MTKGDNRERPSLPGRALRFTLGAARSPEEHNIFHQMSLVAFFAWVGLGADGISSSAYGPPEAYLALGRYHHLALFVALATAFTVIVISASYSQLIELFPSGGGGYLVASKLISPFVGMVAGCALVIDYVLTIAVSIASGVDAVLSFLPPWVHAYKPELAVGGVALMTILNLRGVRESVIPLVPIFLLFLLTHAFAILYAILSHAAEVPRVAADTMADVRAATTALGTTGMVMLLLHAYSMGAGTYTGIEAVSNGLPLLREPRVKTGKRTMVYLAASLALIAVGLMLAYVLYAVKAEPGKTINAVLFEGVAGGWGPRAGYAFVLVTLASEAAILFVAAQTGFVGGPRVIATMSLDRWFPVRFSSLSDRLVTQNGILLMGVAALVTMMLSGGSVTILVILYSINVFVTFVLSQAGMVRHWWSERGKASRWLRGIVVNGLGLVTCVLILVTVVAVKFTEGGWVTILLTGSLVLVALSVRRHYRTYRGMLARLDGLVTGAESLMRAQEARAVATGTTAPREPRFEPKSRTAVLLVSGFNGLGLHSFFSIVRLFPGVFKNFAFVQVGLIDAGNFKGVQEVEHLTEFVEDQVGKYVRFTRANGFYGEGFFSVGVDVVDETAKIAPRILERFPDAVFFGGQTVLPEDSSWSRWLHNYAVFAIQRRLYRQGVPFVVLPVRL